jgi:hyperosmotically inducible periplasmic protein
MNLQCLMRYVVIAAMFGPAISLAVDDSHPAAFVKDSAITTKIKAELAAKHISSLARIHVDTDDNGVVVLTGTAPTQATIDEVVAIARGTEHVNAVHEQITIHQDD